MAESSMPLGTQNESGCPGGPPGVLPANPAQRLVSFVLILVMAIAGMASLTRPHEMPATTPRTEFSAERAMSHIDVIARQPHPMGSPANAEVRDYLVGRLEAMGLRPEVQQATVPDFFGINENAETVELHNVMARLPGTRPGRAIALVGHYDSVPAAPGANDDGCAVAAILEAGRALLAGPSLQNDVILLFTDGEEPGQFRYGASAFVDHHPWARDVGLVLNFEAAGSTGPSLLFETGPSNSRLIREFARAAPYPVAFSYWNDLYKGIAAGGTDFSVFEKDGITGLNFAFGFDRTVYHTALDNPDNVDLRSLQHHGSYALDLARYFGNTDLGKLEDAVVGDAVYFSLFGKLLVHYPAVWAFPLSILIGVLLAGVIVQGLRNGHLRRQHLVRAVLVFPVCVVGCAVLLTFAWWAIDRLHLISGTVTGPTYQVHLYLIGFLLLTVAMVVTSQSSITRRTRSNDLAVAAVLWWWILALLTSLYLPGFSYLFAWPLLGSSAALVFTFRQSVPRSSSWTHVFVVALGAAPGIILVTPAIYSLFQAMGVPSPGFSGSPAFPIIGPSIFLWAMLVGLLIPIMELWFDGRRWRPVSRMLLVALGFLVAGSLVPGIGVEEFGLGG